MVMVSKSSAKHPYAAIEHRVIDSPAYADLSHSACRLLTLLARQLTRENNNGHLQASFAWCKKRGFGSEHTLRDAIADLIAHGFIYRTRSHGANKAWAKYAVCWLSIKNSESLFLAGFKLYAWRDWEPPKEKSSRQKVPEQSGRKCSFNIENPAESAGTTPAENADYELVPCRGSNCSTTTSNKLTSEGDTSLGNHDGDDSFTRYHEDALVEYWDSELGEYRTPAAKTSVLAGVL